ncbi:hypothetical protein GGI23_002998 [Coemansia sp. RSA 2559]|nr:hypothetical protein GGI23_002998 [Coemansia sp. RSA 2559]KAJ2861495.1 hypothetical protein GGI22_002441 [Coemansia erecta]
MAVVDIIIARHGQTQANAKRLLQGGLVDCDLNKRGIQQAQQLAERLRDEPLDWIIASKLVRAAHTAQIVSEYHEGVPLTKDQRLGEVSWGDLDGTSLSECQPIRTKVIDQWRNGNFGAKFPGGESAEECRKRITESFTDILKEAAEKGYKNILMCLHGRIMRVILASLVEKDLTKMELTRHTNCAYYQIQVVVDAEVLAREGVDGLAFKYILKDVRDHLKPVESNESVEC